MADSGLKMKDYAQLTSVPSWNTRKARQGGGSWFVLTGVM